MSFVAERIKKVKASATLALMSKVKALKAEGRPIIQLTLGEPNFDTPVHIQDAAVHAIRNGKIKYTDVGGLIELRTAIRNKFERENGLHYTTDQVMASAGAKQVLLNALTASLNPGDEVIIPAPYWVSYPEMVLMSDGTPVIVDCPMANDFKITPAQLEAAITPKTKWVILNSPNNPTGAVYSKAELQGLAAVLLRFPHVGVISDDIYEHLHFDGLEFHTIAQVEPKLFDRTLTVNGLSKAYAMTGWRLGYAGGPAELIKAMTLVQSQSTTSPNAVAQAAAIEALNGDQICVAKMCNEYQRRRNMMVEKINAAPGLSVASPPGAFYLYVCCQGCLGKTAPNGQKIATEKNFIAYLLEEYNVVVVPGEAFGLSPFFRVTFAISDEEIIEACARMKKACEELR